MFKPIVLRRYRCISDICLYIVWKAGKSQLGAWNTVGFSTSKGIVRQRAFFFIYNVIATADVPTRDCTLKNTFIHIEGARTKKTKKARGRSELKRTQTRESSCWSRFSRHGCKTLYRHHIDNSHTVAHSGGWRRKGIK